MTETCRKFVHLTHWEDGATASSLIQLALFQDREGPTSFPSLGNLYEYLLGDIDVVSVSDFLIYFIFDLQTEFMQALLDAAQTRN